MMVSSYGLKLSGLYRHRIGLGLHRVGYIGRRSRISARLACLPRQGKNLSDTGRSLQSCIFIVLESGRRYSPAIQTPPNPGLPHHVCMKNCIIYRGEHAESTICPVCGVTRYKKRKKAPRKVVWYFPITPRLQRYFADPKVAKLLRWHADREEKKREDDANDPEIDKKDKMLSHPK